MQGVYEDLAPAELALLEQVCRTLDAIGVLEEAAAATPLVEGSKGQQVVNPAVPEARLQRRELARLLDQLGLPDPTNGATAATPSSPAKRRAEKAAEARWSRVAAQRSGSAS